MDYIPLLALRDPTLTDALELLHSIGSPHLINGESVTSHPKVSLIQRSSSSGAFQFSSAQYLSLVPDTQIAKIKIVPTPTDKSSRTLGESSRIDPVKKRRKTGAPFLAMQCLDYGLFSSFAPNWDSEGATVSTIKTMTIIPDAPIECRVFNGQRSSDFEDLKVPNIPQEQDLVNLGEVYLH